ncbi:MAG: GHMP kinase [Terriglobia bacterium]|jgi:D-glycero-alpha-D-manno-heptose-7-phosphate kinase
MRVGARAPARVDLAGGTVDIWPLYLFHPGAQTVNIAIRCYASCVIETRPDRHIVLVSQDQEIQETFEDLADLARGKSRLPLVRELVVFFEPHRGLNIETSSQVPAGAGLGGSSALNIALCGGLARVTGKRVTRTQILEIAKNVEAIVIRVPTGWQDYFPALYGGANVVHLQRDGVKREKLPVFVSDLEKRFVLCYTGQPRDSAINNWEVMKSHIDGEEQVRRNFDQITTIASQMREALLTGDWKDVAELLALEWENRKQNFKGISTPTIDNMIEQTRKQGTVAAKVCGAGGGGCVVFMVEPGTKPAVEDALTQLGGQIINFAVSRTGLEVWADQPGRTGENPEINLP